MKTQKTLDIEKNLWKATMKQGSFGCFEVTIGWFGSERVDYMTYNCKGEFRCYEIKVTKSDFYSKAKHTFCGDFNYYVMPYSLYEQVKQDIPKNIGVLGEFSEVIKRPIRVNKTIEEDVLKNSLIRSLSREVHKYYQSNDADILASNNRKIKELNKRIDEINSALRDKSRENAIMRHNLNTYIALYGVPKNIAEIK